MRDGRCEMSGVRCVVRDEWCEMSDGTQQYPEPPEAAAARLVAAGPRLWCAWRAAVSSPCSARLACVCHGAQQYPEHAEGLQPTATPRAAAPFGGYVYCHMFV